MTTEREPSASDIQALLEFLPKLYGEGAPAPETPRGNRGGELTADS